MLLSRSTLWHRIKDNVLYVTDSGKGMVKALRERFGKKLVHQRCTVHKDRKIQNHLAKKYREAAHRHFRNAIDCHRYQDAKAELLKLEERLETINPSAAESLRECREDLQTVHCLETPIFLQRGLRGIF